MKKLRISRLVASLTFSLLLALSSQEIQASHPEEHSIEMQKSIKMPLGYVGDFEFANLIDEVTIKLVGVENINLSSNGKILEPPFPSLQQELLIQKGSPFKIKFFDRPLGYIDSKAQYNLRNEKWDALSKENTLNTIRFKTIFKDHGYEEDTVFYWGITQDGLLFYRTKSDFFQILGHEERYKPEVIYENKTVKEYKIRYFFDFK